VLTRNGRRLPEPSPSNAPAIGRLARINGFARFRALVHVSFRGLQIIPLTVQVAQPRCRSATPGSPGSPCELFHGQAGNQDEAHVQQIGAGCADCKSAIAFAPTLGSTVRRAAIE
jgi:hypothetical protein